MNVHVFSVYVWIIERMKSILQDIENHDKYLLRDFVKHVDEHKGESDEEDYPGSNYLDRDDEGHPGNDDEYA